MTTRELTTRHNDLVAASTTTTFKPVKVWKASKAKLIERIEELEADASPKMKIVKLADIARDLNMEPKAARARFRRIWKTKLAAVLPDARKGWTFKASDRKLVVAILKGEVELEDAA